LLGITPAPTAENRALNKLRSQVKKLRAQRQKVEARRIAAQQLLAARRQLAVPDVRRQRPPASRGGGLSALLRAARQRRE
jgi:hypothetical protein